MYGWYHTIYPKWPQYNAAVDDTTDSQCYVPNSAQGSTNTALSNESNNVIVNSSGGIFETAFWAGPTVYNSSCQVNEPASQLPSDCINYIPSPSYQMYQNGTQWYSVNDGWTPSTMASQYYSAYGGYVTTEWQPD